MSSIIVRFLDVGHILRIHADTIKHEGGLGGVRDNGLLESAIHTPGQQFDGKFLHSTVPAMAAAYLFHIVNNHAFFDGNKRVGALAFIVFLKLNGIEAIPDPELLERLTLAIANHEMSKAELTEWVEQMIMS